MTTYRVSQLAKRVGLRPTTLRFYEQAGLLPARRSESGYRIFGEDAVERLGFITSGKHLGLPLEDIRELLRVWEGGPCTDVRRSLRPMLLARLSDAEQRTAELAAFTDRLRQALTDIDGPPKPGRCDAGCGYLAEQLDAAPVRFDLTPRRADADPAPIACALSGDDQTERIDQWAALLTQERRREPIEGGVRIYLPAALAGPVAELAAAEQHCCAFFDFTLRLASGSLQLEVRAPEEAAPLLADVFGR